jgi:hypothetical protein
MHSNRKIFATLVLLTLSQFSFSQIRKYSNEFLSIGLGARAMSMGGAQVATSGDVNSVYWNPAGLCEVSDFPQIAAMHSEYFGGIAKYDFVGAAIPLTKINANADADKKSVLGIGLIRFGVDDIPNTLHLLDANGNINYDNVTSFSAADYGFFTSFGTELMNEDRGNKYFRVGGSVKIIHRIVGSFASAWGFGLDAAAQYKNGNWRLGAVLQDATSTFNTWSFHFSDADQAVLAQTGNVIPTRSSEITSPKIRLGGAYNFQIGNDFSVLPELGLDITTDGQRNVLISSSPFSVDPKIGIEGAFRDIVFVRIGLNNIQHQTDDVGNKITTMQPNIGLGLRISQFYIDYALTSPGSIGNVLYSHVISLKLDLGKKESKYGRGGRNPYRSHRR